MRIAVIDDEVMILEIIKDKICEVYKKIDIHLFNNGLDFLNDNEVYDIVLLDIDMPEIDGIELSKIIHEKVGFIIFITSMKERVMEAFGEKVCAFILKEDLDKRLIEELDKVIKKIKKETNLMIKTLNGDAVFKMNEIFCVQMENRKLYLYSYNKQYYIIRETLMSIANKLDERFMFVNRSCVVNVECIASFSRDNIILKNKMMIEVSRGKREECRNRYLDYYNTMKRGWR